DQQGRDARARDRGQGDVHRLGDVRGDDNPGYALRVESGRRGVHRVRSRRDGDIEVAVRVRPSRIRRSDRRGRIDRGSADGTPVRRIRHFPDDPTLARRQGEVGVLGRVGGDGDVRLRAREEQRGRGYQVVRI